VHQNMRRVLTAVDESRGLTIAIGPPGSGKTSLSSSVEHVLLSDESAVIGNMLDTTFGNDVNISVVDRTLFGLNLKSRSSVVLKNAIEHFLFDTAIIEKKTLVLLIDEAQKLTADGSEHCVCCSTPEKRSPYTLPWQPTRSAGSSRRRS
jgi:type II secretory pathway predicted ATPase ExeA